MAPTPPSKRPKTSTKTTADVLTVHGDRLLGELRSETDLLVYIDGKAVANLRAENGALTIRMMGKTSVLPESQNMFTLRLEQ